MWKFKKVEPGEPERIPHEAKNTCPLKNPFPIEHLLKKQL